MLNAVRPGLCRAEFGRDSRTWQSPRFGSEIDRSESNEKSPRLAESAKQKKTMSECRDRCKSCTSYSFDIAVTIDIAAVAESALGLYMASA